MAKKTKRIGPLGWFARAFAAGFGTVAGVMFAAAVGSVLFSGMLSSDWEIPAFAYPRMVPAPTYSTPAVSYPADRTANASSYSYPATSYPVVAPPSISGPEGDRPPEPDVEIEVEYR